MNGSNDHITYDDEIVENQNNFNLLIYESPLVVNNPEELQYEDKLGRQFMKWKN